MSYTFAQIEHAWARQDPQLVAMIVALAHQPDPAPTTRIPDDVLTFEMFLSQIWQADFRDQPDETQYVQRVAMLAQLEAEQPLYPMPERLKLHAVLQWLWQDGSPFAKAVLLQAIRQLPLVYGPWKALKQIYKAAEVEHDYATLGALAARFDQQRDQELPFPYGVSQATKTYMVLRAWRFLRKLGQQLPVCYPDAAIHYLAEYTDDIQQGRTVANRTWVLNHICFHQMPHAYGLYQFNPVQQKRLFHAEYRAFAETWTRSAEPLLRLMGMARSEAVRQWACDALKHDFKLAMREVSVLTLQQLAHIGVISAARDELLVWLLNNTPHYEQHQFAALGLHDMVIGLLWSPYADAQRYACAYAKAHARDLPLDAVLRLAESSTVEVRQLALDLLLARDPRREVGLAAWGQLLDSSYHHEVATKQLHQHFGRTELDAAWFTERLLSGQRYSVAFATTHLLALHPSKTLGAGYFDNIACRLGAAACDRTAMMFVLTERHTLGLADLAADTAQILLLHPLAQSTLIQWIQSDSLKAARLDMAYWQALAYEPDWQQSRIIDHIRQHYAKPIWQSALDFDPDLAAQVRDWLADVRRFVPKTLGFDWLMQLAQRDEAHYHDFAVDRMIKAFIPADFAPANLTDEASVVATDTQAPLSSVDTPAVDLQQQSFLFTGKLSSMTREQAEQMVSTANGKNVGTVNAKLDYLVIGDEGSPLYGNGRKGSKQVKAESLITQGATLKVISETAFLQMISGNVQDVSIDQTLMGCEMLWQMAIGQPSRPTSRLAVQYIRHHHPELCLSLTDRPVDPDAVIPSDFFSLARFAPVLIHGQQEMRQFALDIARFELARWSPSAEQLVPLVECKHADVRSLIHEALLESPNPSNRYYHLDASRLSLDTVFALCESKQDFARQLAIQIMSRHAVFQQPEVLFQLTQSPDRTVRATALRMLWRLYRHYATTPCWTPYVATLGTLGPLKQIQHAKRLAEQGTGLPSRPAALPADQAQMQQLLKRWLFELPPSRLGRTDHQEAVARQRPIAASRAKHALIELFRDLALEDANFAKLVLPLFQSFSRSRGQLEQAACLVAVTRIQHRYPMLGAA